MSMPNFLIIGAVKAGTTSLYSYLEQHQQIYMSPIKEPNFFALEGQKLNFPLGTISQTYLAGCKTSFEAYYELFQGVSDQIAIGEASPIYLYYPQAPERIKNAIPNVKLIAILRHPVERAYSNFLHHIREGYEPILDFAQAIEQEEKRIHSNWWCGFYYVKAGFYYAQLKHYFDLFDRNQIKIYLYEDLSSEPLNVIRDIFKFLNVNETFTPNLSTKYNVSGVPKSKLFHNFLTKPNFIKSTLKLFVPPKLRQQMSVTLKNQNLNKPQLALEVRNQLLGVYREDILQLQDLLQRDLANWLK